MIHVNLLEVFSVLWVGYTFRLLRRVICSYYIWERPLNVHNKWKTIVWKTKRPKAVLQTFVSRYNMISKCWTKIWQPNFNMIFFKELFNWKHMVIWTLVFKGYWTPWLITNINCLDLILANDAVPEEALRGCISQHDAVQWVPQQHLWRVRGAEPS